MADQPATDRAGRPKIDLEDLPEGERELAAEETEAAKGGAISRLQGTKPGSSGIMTDACDGGEATEP